MSLNLGQYIHQAQSLSHAQQLLMKQALALLLELRAPSFPNPLRGMDGIVFADKLLKERNLAGLLVGGLADAVWNRRRTVDELAAHKDVDVLVISEPEQSEFDKFEGGIDWWEPKDVFFKSIRTISGTMENITKRFWMNGNGVTLCYRIKWDDDLEPGLYFPSPEFAVRIRLCESMAFIDDSVGVVDDVDLFSAALRRKLGIRTCLPAFIERDLRRFPVPYVGQRSWAMMPFRLEDVTLEEQRALNDDMRYHIGPDQK